MFSIRKHPPAPIRKKTANTLTTEVRRSRKLSISEPAGTESADAGWGATIHSTEYTHCAACRFVWVQHSYACNLEDFHLHIPVPLASYISHLHRQQQAYITKVIQTFLFDQNPPTQLCRGPFRALADGSAAIGASVAAPTAPATHW